MVIVRSVKIEQSDWLVFVREQKPANQNARFSLRIACHTIKGINGKCPRSSNPQVRIPGASFNPIKNTTDRNTYVIVGNGWKIRLITDMSGHKCNTYAQQKVHLHE